MRLTRHVEALRLTCADDVVRSPTERTSRGRAAVDDKALDANLELRTVEHSSGSCQLDYTHTSDLKGRVPIRRRSRGFAADVEKILGRTFEDVRARLRLDFGYVP